MPPIEVKVCLNYVKETQTILISVAAKINLKCWITLDFQYLTKVALTPSLFDFLKQANAIKTGLKPLFAHQTTTAWIGIKIILLKIK